jgi:hypothetical protein
MCLQISLYHSVVALCVVQSFVNLFSFCQVVPECAAPCSASGCASFEIKLGADVQQRQLAPAIVLTVLLTLGQANVVLYGTWTVMNKMCGIGLT